jgi:integrase
MFYCCTGFRLSEGLSIDPRKDIDRKRHIITLTMTDKSTKKHKREVPYLPELLKGFDLTKSTLFPDITQNGARQYFSKLFRKYNIDAVFHSFRHTFISCCNHIGIPPKHIQSWAGHSSIIMTMDTYTHILEDKNTPIFDYLKALKKRLKL